MTLELFERRLMPLEPAMFRFALSCLDDREDAEDVVQDVLETLWKDRGRLDEVVNLEAYCIGITKRQCAARIRRLAREGALKGEEMAETAEVQESGREELLDELERSLQSLSPPQRRAIEMKYFEGRRSEEIARELGMSADNLRATISRGYKNLRKLLTLKHF